jgi:hypothetical protein
VVIDPPDPGEYGWLTVDLRDRYGLTGCHAADADRLEAGADERVTGGMTIAGDIEACPSLSPGDLPGTGTIIRSDDDGWRARFWYHAR